MAHLGHQLAAPEGHLEKEPQRRDRRVQADPGDTALAEVQLIAAQILRRGGIRGTPKEAGEILHPADVPALGLLRELAQAHVLDHALTQGADRLYARYSWVCSCLEVGWYCTSNL